MSRGLGKVQRWLLVELAKPSGGFPPWITVEALAARYAGGDVGEPVSTGYLEPNSPETLIGLSVESHSQCIRDSTLNRAVVESVRRAAKVLAAAGHIEARHFAVDGRGASQYTTYGRSRRGVVAMYACRRLLTDREAAEPWHVAKMAARAAFRARYFGGAS